MRTRHLLLAAIALAAAPAAADVGKDDARLGEVYFRFDSARVDVGFETIANIARWSVKHPEMTIVLDGHADPQGPADYNVGLALRRAAAIQRGLVARGVDPDRIVIVTYGKDAAPRATYARDRRVTAWGTTLPLYAIIDRAFHGGTAVLWNNPVDQTALVAPASVPVARQ